MKKTLLFLSLFPLASMSAQTLTAPKAAWANFVIGKPGQDQSTAIATDGNNQVYWLLTDGSTTSDKDVTYAGQLLYEGADYDGTSANKNLTVLKTNANGEKQWCVYSVCGDFAPNEGGIAVNGDGDIVFSTTVRHTDGYLQSPITIVDAKGKSTVINWSVERRYDRLIVGTITSDGELKWVKTYEIDHNPVPAASGATRTEHTADAINTYGLTVDDNNNIYICGNFRTDLTIPKVDGTDVVLKPKNVTGWNGDSQSVVGSFYLIKLDSNGYYLNHLAETGDEITASYIQKIDWKDGNLYAYGYLKGKDGGSITVSGFTLKPTDNCVSPIVGCFNSDLNASWLKCFPGDAVGGSSVIQNVGMTISGDNIWLAGQYNGKISDTDDDTKFVASTTRNPREGFVIKLDKNGNWLKAANSKTNFSEAYVTGYFKVIVPPSDSENVYVYGYAMNANVGVFLRSYDRETLVGNPDKSWNIITRGGVPTCQCIVYAPEICSAFVTVRGNNAFQPMGGELTENPGGYVNLLARFDLPKSFTSGINDIETNNVSDLQVIPANGCIYVNNTSDTSLRFTMFDLTGRSVVDADIASGASETIAIASGIYIANGKKVLVK